MNFIYLLVCLFTYGYAASNKRRSEVSESPHPLIFVRDPIKAVHLMKYTQVAVLSYITASLG